MSRHSTRRRFLQGLGVSLALPTLESLSLPKALGASTTAAGSPLRTAFLYVPNGVILDKWRPDGVGSDYKLNHTMEPLAPFKKDFSIVTGLGHQHGFSNGDGAGDHARATATISCRF